MRFFRLLLLILLCSCTPAVSGFNPSGGLRAQELNGDSVVVYALPEATVRASDVQRSPFVPAPIAALRIAELPTFDNANLLPVLNRVAGVRFEQRATASYRVAIRGASLRAPFGVRNVQVFWNGIPFGEPGGDVPLNFLDAVNVDEVTIIRGPNGGRYGAGTAGTLLLGTRPVSADSIPAARLSLSGGSYGFARLGYTVNKGNRFGGTDEFRVGLQRTDGYREHSAMQRLTAQFSSNLGRTTKLHALYTDLSYELPGGLNAQQAAENPRQARPGSVDTDASINYNNLLVGLTNTQTVGRFRTESSAYATGFYFDHPFNFDYKREINLGAGGRTVTSYLTGDWAVSLGAQFQLQQRNGQNFENEGGQPGALNFSDEIYSSQGLVFLEGRYAPGNWDFQAGLTTSGLSYTVDRTFDAGGNTGVTEFTTDRPLSVRLSAGYRFGRHYLYAARADGFSPPTLDEFRTNEGSLNVDLGPEIGTNYELGYRLTGGGLEVEAIGFLFALDEAITTFSDGSGRQLFRNAGRTRQAGLELSARAARITDLAGGYLHGMANYTYYNFTYRNLMRGDLDLSGQTIPGAAPQTVNLELGWVHPRGLYLTVFHNFTDATPLNDAGDVVAPSFHNLRASVGYKWPRVEVFLSGNNLLDDELNLGYDLNVQFGNRYFQPAPGRTGLAGVRVSLGG